MSFWVNALKGVKDVAKTSGTTILHPVRTGRSVLNLATGAIATSAGGYAAWNYFVNDKSLGRTLGEMVIGEGATSTITDGAKKLTDVAKDVSEAVGGVKQVTKESKNIFSGISDFFKNASSGNAGDMFGSFFSNLINGKITGGNIIGLIAAAFLVFGRFGWLGKIAGALLGMMMIGNNSKVSLKKSPSSTDNKESLSINKESVKTENAALIEENLKGIISRSEIEENERSRGYSR